jgi:hypothetical protein
MPEILLREVTEEMMPDLTEEEYDALDELWTNNPPAVSGNRKDGFFMKHRGEIVLLDNVSAAYLRAKSDTTHKTPTEIIGELVMIFPKQTKSALYACLFSPFCP